MNKNWLKTTYYNHHCPSVSTNPNFLKIVQTYIFCSFWFSRPSLPISPSLSQHGHIVRFLFNYYSNFYLSLRLLPKNLLANLNQTKFRHPSRENNGIQCLLHVPFKGSLNDKPNLFNVGNCWPPSPGQLQCGNFFWVHKIQMLNFFIIFYLTGPAFLSSLPIFPLQWERSFWSQSVVFLFYSYILYQKSGGDRETATQRCRGESVRAFGPSLLNPALVAQPTYVDWLLLA